jgi:hypothetical protein
MIEPLSRRLISLAYDVYLSNVAIGWLLSLWFNVAILFYFALNVIIKLECLPPVVPP